MCALFTNIDMFLTNRRKKEKSNIIITYFAIINVFLIVLSYPLIIISNAQKEYFKIVFILNIKTKFSD